jgi:serine/threonine protein kinase
MTNLLKVGQVFDDKYEITGLLGSGGLGSVYTARQTQANRMVALKIMHASVADDEELEARFIREAQVLGRLSHLNVVQVYHLGISVDGFPYIAMELIDGINIRRAMNERGAFPLMHTLRIMRDAAVALSYVHSQGVIHRDLKLDNILLTELPAHDTVKIIDFGLAHSERAAELRLTQTGELLGTTDYMSPEQCQGTPVDERSDIYSLAVCLYEMLTNKKPFSADSGVGVMYKHLNEPVPKMVTSTKLKRFHPLLNDLIRKGMAKSPEERFQTMSEFASRLNDLLDNLEGASSRQPPAYSRILLLLGILGVLALVIVSAPVYLNPSSPERGLRPKKKAEPSDALSRERLPKLLQQAATVDNKWTKAQLLHDAFVICNMKSVSPVQAAVRHNVGMWYVQELEKLALSVQAYTAGLQDLNEVEKNGIPEAYGLGHELGKGGYPWRDYLDSGHTVVRILIDWQRRQEAARMLKAVLSRVHPKSEDSWSNLADDLVVLKLDSDFQKLIDDCNANVFLLAASRAARAHGKLNLSSACLKRADAVSRSHVQSRDYDLMLALEHAGVELELGKKRAALERVNRFARSDLGSSGTGENAAGAYLSAAYAVLGETSRSQAWFAKAIDGSLKDLSNLPPAERCLLFCRRAETLEGENSPLCYAYYASVICRQEGRAIPEGLRLRSLFDYAESLKAVDLPSMAIPVYEELLKGLSPETLAGMEKQDGSLSIKQAQKARCNLSAIWISLDQPGRAQKTMDASSFIDCGDIGNRDVVRTELMLGRVSRIEEMIPRISDIDSFLAILPEFLRFHQWGLAEKALARARVLSSHTPGHDQTVMDLSVWQAFLRLEQGDRTASRKILTELLETDPEKSKIKPRSKLWYQLGLALALAGMHEESREILK